MGRAVGSSRLRAIVFAPMLAFVGLAVHAHVQPPEAQAVCSCGSDCPDPLREADSLVIGRVTGWREVDPASQADSIPSADAVPIEVTVEVTEWYRNPAGPYVVIEETLRNNRGIPTWEGKPGCFKFQGGPDPTGEAIAIAVYGDAGSQPVSQWFLLGVFASDEAEAFIRARIREAVGPLPPAAGSGTTSQSRDWAATAAMALLAMAGIGRSRSWKRDHHFVL